ncbi:TetR/AcrR family transcriptional regulator [Sphingobium sp. H39-3-25]|uniref:TetR/AcrR family transcriptional regulator n=1 Tax=Sphingobium arseniciresistens TaxID=3030834 RepID=UPI0023BA0F76|nr:TetR/AcrR family transcriptional regulator [Sphingobium arseniciresistens]
MKVTREQAARNRETVVDVASRLFRTHGVEGVGIGEIMRESGLTHGGFYGQFGSKEMLAAEACRRALDASATRWTRIADAHPDDAVTALATDYLSARNRDMPETGCALVALAADAARRGGDVAAAFRQGLLNLADIIAQSPPESDADRALAVLSQMVGAMTIARAVNDDALSDRIMTAARKALAKAE